MNRSDATLARIVDAAATDNHRQAADQPRVKFPELPAPAHPLGSMPFPEAARAWLLTRRDHIAPRTYLDYARHIETVSRCFRNIVLSDITGDMLRDYQRHRRQTAGPGMINKECGVVRMVRDRINLPLTDYQPLPLPKDYESPGRALTDAECSNYRSLKMDRRRHHYLPAKWRSCTVKRCKLLEENASLKKGLEFLLGPYSPPSGRFLVLLLLCSG